MQAKSIQAPLFNYYKNVGLLGTRAGKNLGFFRIFFRFLGFLSFLGFNVHNAEHRYMTHEKWLIHENNYLSANSLFITVC